MVSEDIKESGAIVEAQCGSSSEGAKSFDSVEAIVTLFQEVDQKIQDLHQCSADDFLGLNAKFKNFYKETKSVSSDAGALLALFSHERNEELRSDLASAQQDLSRSLQAMRVQQHETLRLVHDLGDAMSGYLYPLLHINNEFGILNVEFLTLDVGFSRALHKYNFDATRFQHLRDEWATFVVDITETKRLSHNFLEESSYSINHIELIGGRGLRSLVTLLDLTEQGKLLFETKQRESNENLPVIHAKSDSVAKSIADVITSLQYQDIIRQKMEHIQQAHIRLLDELRKTDIKGSTDSWTKVLVQVRDLSALQAAQLLATNKEYQSAIETIALHFRTIAKEMLAVASICRSTMNENEDRDHRTAMSDLVDRFRRADALLARVLDVFPECSREVRLIRDGAMLLQQRVAKHVETFSHLYEQVYALLGPYRDQLGGHFERYMVQVDEMLGTMRRNMESVSVKNTIILKSLEGLGYYAEQLDEHKHLWNSVQIIVQRAHALAERLLSTERDSNALLGKIDSTCRSISDETQAALSAVRYYDIFENVIGEIVRGLSSLSTQICDSVDLEVHGDMSSVRDLYTMESERKIHDQFIGGESEEEAPVDDDLELF
ncbi:MAG: hypothetical protein ACTTKZ_06640 [Bacteroides sp.]